MRLIDVEPLECVVSITPKGVDAKSYNEGYKDALELMDKQPTIDAVPLKPLCAWLAGYATPPKYALDHFPESGHCLANTRAAAWEHHIRTMMECGLLQEEQDGTDNP